MKIVLSMGAALVIAALATACGGETTARQIDPTAPPIAVPSPTPPPTDTAAPVSPTATTALTPAPTESPTDTPQPAPTPTAPALSAEQQALLARYPPKGAAPPVENEVWLNSPPLAWESLAGKVVIVEFWTYG